MTVGQLAIANGDDASISALALDRWLAAGAGERVALTFVGPDLRTDPWTWHRLAAEAERFASMFAAAGIGKGDGIFTLLGRVPALYLTALAAWRRRAVFSSLFASFGPQPIATRLHRGHACALVTTADLYRRKIAAIRDSLPALRDVFLIDGEAAGCQSLASALAAVEGAPPAVAAAADAETPAFVHFTSGTTGAPKGAVHVHGAATAMAESARLVLGYAPAAKVWCTADPGWITGVAYGLIAPLVTGASAIIDEGDFEIGRWYQLIARHRVESWYTSPTALRMLMRGGVELPRQYDLSSLRIVASVGEPLNPEVVRWGEAAFGLSIRDTWWQTETGSILIANGWNETVVPGALGYPLPGIDAAIVERLPSGAVAEIVAPTDIGELAIRRPWPGMFRGFLDDPERTAQAFAGDWYLTGDLARRDAAGRFRFVGRADDIISSAGHRIGPFEVESALMEHPSVAEAGVVGVPDPLIGERVKAFVVLKPGYEGTPELERGLLALARRRLGPTLAPREITFMPALPKTRSGKILRRVLKCRELGLPEGDLSTLETAEPG
ncbi:MAG: AMP-binding protein [Rhodospirillales bacterium]|jgi:acetyl-CoA synthetase|nr:AMP-binding protein [Rhodospirillales bacterium]